jgi:hypothetical protein
MDVAFENHCPVWIDGRGDAIVRCIAGRRNQKGEDYAEVGRFRIELQEASART